jgi:hypothetical protein
MQQQGTVWRCGALCSTAADLPLDTAAAHVRGAAAAVVAVQQRTVQCLLVRQVALLICIQS